MLFRIVRRPFRQVTAALLSGFSRAYYRHSILTMSKTDHAQRTVTEPRDPSLHKVVLARVEEINPTIRTFRLDIPSPASGIKFLPGQWLDVYVPGIEKPGGFTITSPPSQAVRSIDSTASRQPSSFPDTDHDGKPSNDPYLELAVQKTPDNVVAKWLWQPISSILSSEILVRVGGSFVWPPPGILPMTLRNIVFIAGGVGINPLMSILSHLAESPPANATIHFLYSTRDPGHGKRDAHNILFLERLARILDGKGLVKGELKIFLTPGPHSRSEGTAAATVSVNEQRGQMDGLGLPFQRQRITVDDVARVIGTDKRSSVVYLCGLPTMTDEFVRNLTSPGGLGLEMHRVLYEKWW